MLREALCRQIPELLAKIMLYEFVFIQRIEIWPRVCYMTLCVDRDLNCDQSLLHQVVCGQRP